MKKPGPLRKAVAGCAAFFMLSAGGGLAAASESVLSASLFPPASILVEQEILLEGETPAPETADAGQADPPGGEQITETPGMPEPTAPLETPPEADGTPALPPDATPGPEASENPSPLPTERPGGTQKHTLQMNLRMEGTVTTDGMVYFLVAMVSSVSGADAPSGRITFYADGLQVGQTAAAFGDVTVPWTPGQVGAHEITAEYTPTHREDCYFPAYSLPLVALVMEESAPAPTADEKKQTLRIDLRISPAVVQVDACNTLTAVVSLPQSGETPRGTIAFMVDGQPVAHRPAAEGVVTAGWMPQQAGSYLVSAEYIPAADEAYMGADTGILSVTALWQTLSIRILEEDEYPGETQAGAQAGETPAEALPAPSPVPESPETAPGDEEDMPEAPATEPEPSAPEAPATEEFPEAEPEATEEPPPVLDIARMIIESPGVFAYTGEAIEPTVYVESEGVALLRGLDYEISYRSNTAVGPYAYVIITGAGRYAGTQAVPFEIRRVETSLALRVLEMPEGNALRLFATVSAEDGAMPGGDVHFYMGGKHLGASSLNPLGEAVFTVEKGALPSLGGTLRAVYAGTDSHADAEDGQQIFLEIPKVDIPVGDVAQQLSESVAEEITRVRETSRTALEDVLAAFNSIGSTLAAGLGGARAGPVETATLLTISGGGPFAMVLEARVRVPEGGDTPRGAVTFYHGEKTLGSLPVNGQSRANLALNGVPAGAYESLRAVYSGSDTYARSLSDVAAHTVDRQPAGLAFSILDQGDGTYTLSAGVSSLNGLSPTGQVAFCSGDTLLRKQALDKTGQASYRWEAPEGEHAVYAVYLGDDNFLPGESAREQVTGSASAPDRAAPALSVEAQPEVAMLLLRAEGRRGVPSGQVAVFLEGVIIASATLDAEGMASITLPELSRGVTHLLKVVYQGDDAYTVGAYEVAYLLPLENSAEELIYLDLGRIGRSAVYG